MAKVGHVMLDTPIDLLLSEPAHLFDNTEPRPSDCGDDFLLAFSCKVRWI